MTNVSEYEPAAGPDQPQTSPAGSSTEMLRALTLALDDATVGSLASARGLLAQGTPGGRPFCHADDLGLADVSPRGRGLDPLSPGGG